ncbi:CPBP family intramembrane glutamic endopeptidase [[Mycobacterium] vasticus]|uniref:CPBP family intramembrane glutamic endopeptidase n=1 Tax=[Mycobacterium] vasticus TaxID=2875777 RepID=A0ABU5Z7Y8_9MYCO|nr:CPBP family intramembrane glutamic endopeptidase [Mycolicibacter sp. MYC017]MEB3072043.1 CPBP family intramembrane glutamic endopeptidase [Mycolicibacter sp. MYC017]
MRILLMLWWTGCAIQTWIGDPWWRMPGVGVVMMTAATIFVVLLWQCSPRGRGVRAGVYVSALVALQSPAVVSAVWPLLPEHPPIVVRPSAVSAAVTAAAAVMAVTAWLLVRAWLSAGRRSYVSHRPARAWRDTAGLAALVIALYFLADIAAHGLKAGAQAAFGVEGMSGYPDVPGSGFAAFGWALATYAPAGAVEEPVYVGLLALLWPRLRARTFIPLALVSSLARASMHVYYAAGATPLVAAIGAVVLWCAVWSSASLLLIYRSRMLWPVIVGHGLLNAVGVVGDDYRLGGVLLTAVVMTVPPAALGVLSFAGLRYGLVTYGPRLRAAAVRRSWVRPLSGIGGGAASAANAGLVVQVEGGGQAAVDRDRG